MQYSGVSIYRREEEDEPGLNVPAAGPPIFGRRAIEYIERAYSKRRWAAIHHHAISDPQTVLHQLCVDSWWIPIKNSGWFISICTHTSRRILMKDNGSIAWPAFNFLFGFFLVVVVSTLFYFFYGAVGLENRNSLGQFYDSFHGQQFAASIDGALYCIRNIIMIGRLGFIDRKIGCSGNSGPFCSSLSLSLFF